MGIISGNSEGIEQEWEDNYTSTAFFNKRSSSGIHDRTEAARAAISNIIVSRKVN